MTNERKMNQKFPYIMTLVLTGKNVSEALKIIGLTNKDYYAYMPNLKQREIADNVTAKAKENDIYSKIQSQPTESFRDMFTREEGHTRWDEYADALNTPTCTYRIQK